MKKTGYSEPSSYFPKAVRQKAKIGEFNDDKKAAPKTTGKTTAKKSPKK